jgi:Arc/MetJ-type ribon-helix-helix transcriptional regulator
LPPETCLASNECPYGRSDGSLDRVTSCITQRYTFRMTIQVPTRFRDVEVDALDELVADGVADSRSDAIRLAVARLSDEHRRRKVGKQIAAAYRAVPPSAQEDAWAMASAMALTEAEPW